VTTTIRRARSDDLDFLFELVNDVEVEPFLGGRAARGREALAAEIERSESDPVRYGRFVIEVDGERAGAMGFETENWRSRIARLERLALGPAFRGRGVADEAARLLQTALVAGLGYHRLELEVYGFNARAQRHAERAGFALEGVRRKAYWRHGEWMDGVLYSLIRDDLDVADALALFHDYVLVHNECVRMGDWEPLADWFAADAELAFEGVPVGPFHGRAAIAGAYRERPPDDEVLIFGAAERDGRVVADYGWLREPGTRSGQMLVTLRDGKISRLVVTFSAPVAPG
jgi:RimJ/RimL family protein N-acetyltransferase